LSDIALAFEDLRGGDLVLSATGQDLARDDGLESAVILSLFTDRRATPEQIREGDDRVDLRGWWGDFAADVEGDRFGSLLWLLRREKQTADTLARGRQYATDALAWMVEDLVAQAVDVSTEYIDRGVMGIAVVIARPDGERRTYRYHFEWTAQAAKRVT
jgi:phage gp46-like protein